MAERASILWDTIGPLRPARCAARAARGAGDRCAPLGEFLRGASEAREPILILVNDPHRSTRTPAALAQIADAAEKLSRPPRFEALVATGTHTFSADERERFESQTFHGCGISFDCIDWHDALDAGAQRRLAGFRINRRLVERTWLLAIGSVEPHYFAGATGAHKTLTVGCLHRDEIERNHAGALDPGADVLALEGNPVHDGIVAVLNELTRAGKQICAVNQVLCGDDLLAVAVGDPLITLAELLPIVRETYVRTVARPYDLLVLEVPLPLGQSLYQADKALKNNHRAVRNGGGIVLLAECPAGVGPDAFFDLLRRADTYQAALRMVRAEGYRLGDHKAVKLRHLTDPAARGVRVAIVSRTITDDHARTAGMTVFAQEAAALAWLGSALSAACERGLRIADAGNVSVRTA